MNGSTEIAQRVTHFITDSLLLGRAVDVAAAPSFLEAGIIDSTGVLELVQFLEESFGVTVEDTEMTPDNLDALANIVRFVEKKTASKPSSERTTAKPVTASLDQEQAA